MVEPVIEFLLFVVHAAVLSDSMNRTLEYYSERVKLTTVQEAAGIVYELSCGDIRSFSFV